MSESKLRGISPGEVYPLHNALREAGLGRYTLRRLKADGLPVLYVGRASFVRGSDLIAALERSSKPTRWATGSPRKEAAASS